MYIDFKRANETIPFEQVLEMAGYKWDRKSGRTQPEFRRGEKGSEDRVIIKHNGLPDQHYWSRTGNVGGGDVVNFIKWHIEDFAHIPGVDLSRHNKMGSDAGTWENVAIVAKALMGEPYEVTIKPLSLNSVAEEHHMDPNRYKAYKSEVSDLGYLTAIRKIAPETIEKFLPFITRVQDTQASNSFLNVGFPYTRPGSDEVVGYEIRNVGYGGKGFKSMAAGTDKENASWIATNAANPAEVKRIFFFESAIDALSFYEIKGKNLLHDSVFVSLGGQMGKNQVKNVLDAYPQAKVYTGFDNDVAGRIYDVRVFMASIGKDVEVFRQNEGIMFKYDNKTITIKEDELKLSKFKEETGIRKKFGYVYKAAEGYKDWNEQLVKQKTEAEQRQDEKHEQTKQVKL